MHVEEVIKRAEIGDPQAQFELAYCLAHGIGFETADVAQALLWYQKAALQNHPRALYNLGTHYDKGLGTDKDLKKAQELFIAAAWRGVPQAQYNAAALYIRSRPPLWEEAGAWLFLARAGGLPEAQKRLDTLRPKLQSLSSIDHANAWEGAAALFEARFGTIYGQTFHTLLKEQEVIGEGLEARETFETLRQTLGPPGDDSPQDGAS